MSHLTGICGLGLVACGIAAAVADFTGAADYSPADILVYFIFGWLLVDRAGSPR